IYHFGHADNNPRLQERLKSGAAYFMGKLNEIIETPFNSAAFQTDNKAIRKSVSDGVGKLEKEIAIKTQCLKQIETAGFNIKTYLETKSKAAIEQPVKAKASRKVLMQTTHPEFFSMLNSWRYQKADELNIEISKILRQTLVENIAEEVPATASALKAIKGMGGKKMQQFGKEILAMALQYRKSKAMEVPPNIDDEILLAGLDTKAISFELFNRGLSPSEIAQKRKMALSTIENHLFSYVAQGELDVFRLIDNERYDIISSCIRESDKKTASAIREQLGETFSYNEIRLVLADMG
ncbi:MAG TPA: helix-turn-helix domain-containing protein, partial [Prolixibacteraceae bacterium]|nr:helix-turn-helix domain-containing protein [Prolixibacteraceae bacterium]